MTVSTERAAGSPYTEWFSSTGQAQTMINAKLAISGAPMLKKSRLLGHSSTGVTEKRQVHLHPDDTKSIVKLLNV